MNIKLKKAIIDWLFENITEFQITNACTRHFRQYIYTDKGEFCIGGDEVYYFINDAVKLLK
jgi:hypothetical protein